MKRLLKYLFIRKPGDVFFAVTLFPAWEAGWWAVLACLLFGWAFNLLASAINTERV